MLRDRRVVLYEGPEMSERDDAFSDFGAATPAEIQRAHDLLHAIVCGDVRAPLMLENFRLLHATHDTLSWVLGFKCGETFRKVITAVARTLRDTGATAWRNPPPA